MPFIKIQLIRLVTLILKPQGGGVPKVQGHDGKERCWHMKRGPQEWLISLETLVGDGLAFDPLK